MMSYHGSNFSNQLLKALLSHIACNHISNFHPRLALPVTCTVSERSTDASLRHLCCASPTGGTVTSVIWHQWYDTFTWRYRYEDAALGLSLLRDHNCMSFSEWFRGFFNIVKWWRHDAKNQLLKVNSGKLVAASSFTSILKFSANLRDHSFALFQYLHLYIHFISLFNCNWSYFPGITLKT